LACKDIIVRNQLLLSHPQWDSSSVRALRQHLGVTQQELSQELGVRQQTVSEWESGKYQPRGACARVLTLVAERVGFAYQINPDRRYEKEETRAASG